MKEICVKTGYSDPNYFSRSFKKNVGVTPTEYKENRGKGQEQAVYKKKRRICVAWLLGMMLLLCACGNLETGKDQGEVAENDKIQIGMSFDSFVIERWQRDRDIFVSTAKELGAEVNVQNANGDLEQQKKQINYFIDKGMDVIVVICIDSKGLTEEVQRAKDAGLRSLLMTDCCRIQY